MDDLITQGYGLADTTPPVVPVAESGKAKVAALCQAIVDVLNTTDLSIKFTAVRQPAPMTAQQVQDLKETSVIVFAGSRRTQIVSRGTRKKGFVLQRWYKPIVAIQRALNLETTEANQELSDSLIVLIEEIEDTISKARTLIGLGFEGFGEEQDQAWYSAEIMRDLNIFAAGIVLEFTGWPTTQSNS